MILPKPVRFDANEWWILAGLIVLTFTFLLLPKRFPPVLTFVLLLFTANVAITVDFILAPDYPFNAYDAMDTPQYDLFDFILDTINYSLYGYLFLYVYDRWRPKRWRFVLYMLGWIAVSLVMEWISIQLNVFRYIHWNLAYSAIAYACIFSLYLLFLRVAKHALSKAASGKMEQAAGPSPRKQR